MSANAANHHEHLDQTSIHIYWRKFLEDMLSQVEAFSCKMCTGMKSHAFDKHQEEFDLF